MYVHTAERAEPLAARLAEVYAHPPADPFTPEWVAVPSEGMRRWLYLELARHLGAAGPEATDGVTANVRSAFPGSLRLQVLQAEVGENDPWRVEALTWAVLAVADEHPDDPLLDAVNAVPTGGSRYAKARRIADLFDRYHVHRPEMVRQWAMGNDADSSAVSNPKRLAPHHRWQPHLWRLVREQLVVPSPPERLPGLLERLRDGDLALDLPERLAVFGLSVLPGGAGFVDLAEAIAAHHDLHLFLLEPSTVAANEVGTTVGSTSGPRTRAEDTSGDVVHHPLLRSWGRLHRETSVLLADVRKGDLFSPLWQAPTEGDAPSSLLQHLQHEIRRDHSPSASVVPAEDDRSVQVHACYGPTRQVEVLRDAVLHLLADPDLGLTEDDIVIACPDLPRFAPLISAVFGPSTDSAWVDGIAPEHGADHPPALRYRIADRTIRGANPVLAATLSLLEMVGSRFDAPTVLDFLALGPVRERQGFGEDDLAQVGEWIDETNVRWGLHPQHREQHGLSPAITANTWREALDRLLLGAAVADDELALGIGEVVPLGVEGDRAALVGRLADVLWRLGELAQQAATPRPLDQWLALVQETTHALFGAPRDASWQLEALERLLGELVESAVVAGHPSTTPLEFADLRRLLTDRLDGAPSRPDFFRGGITVSSLTPLRWLPYRVVCLLGMDQAALGIRSVDGDDLAALAPRLGDRDRRAEARQELLEAVLAAGDRLVVVRDGHDVRTNQTIPPAVAVAELTDAVLATVRDDVREVVATRLQVDHPRQPFDERCFLPGALGAAGPWSFDPGALAGATARQQRAPQDDAPFLRTTLQPDDAQVVELDDLCRFLKHPVRSFFERRLQVRFPKRSEVPRTRLPVDFGGLDKWKVGDRLLNALLQGRTVEEWARIERRRGTLPPAALGDTAVAELSDTLDTIVARAHELGLGHGTGEPHVVDVELGDGTRVVGAVVSRLETPTPGPAQVLFSRFKQEHRVRAWIELMALVATDPTPSWRSLLINRAERKGVPYDVVDLEPRVDPTDAEGRRASAVGALEVAVDLYRRGTAEPLPLFPALSPEVFRGKGDAGLWELSGYGYSAEKKDAATALAFDRYDYESLLAEPVRPDDPEGVGDQRVARFANVLYGTIDATARDRADDDQPADAQPADAPEASR